MNKTLTFVLASAAVCGFGAVVGLSYAQAPNTNKTGIVPTGATNPNPGATMAPPTVVPTRTAVVNINKVLKNFAKAQYFNENINRQLQAFQTQINAKREEVAKLQADLAKTVDPIQKDQIEKTIMRLTRDMQDMDAEARKQLGVQQGNIAVDIFKNIEGVIQRVAAANGFDLVLSYPDATTDAELYSQVNVFRKLSSQAAIPLFYRPHIDITDVVVQTLNATYPVQQANNAPAAPNAPGVPPRQ